MNAFSKEILIVVAIAFGPICWLLTRGRAHAVGQVRCATGLVITMWVMVPLPFAFLLWLVRLMMAGEGRTLQMGLIVVFVFVFAVGVLGLAISLTRFRMQFDEQGLRFTTLTREHSLLWADIDTLDYSNSSRLLRFQSASRAAFALAPYHAGAEAFATMALDRLPAATMSRTNVLTHYALRCYEEGRGPFLMMVSPTFFKRWKRPQRRW